MQHKKKKNRDLKKKKKKKKRKERKNGGQFFRGFAYTHIHQVYFSDKKNLDFVLYFCRS